MSKTLYWRTAADWDNNREEALVEHQGHNAKTVRPCPLPTDGLVGYWPRITQDGTEVPDEAGSNHGTPNTPTRDVGTFGPAMRFDGVGATATEGDSIDLAQFTVDHTSGSVVVWVETDADFQPNYGNRGCLFGKNLYSRLYALHDNGGDYAVHAETDTNGEYWVRSGHVLAKGEPHVLVTSLDGGTVTTYANGEQIDQQTVADDITFWGLGGGASDPDYNWYEGLMGEPAFYDRPLSASEAADIYDRLANGWSASLETQHKQ